MDNFQKQEIETKNTKPVFFYWKMVLVLLLILVVVFSYLFFSKNNKPKEFSPNGGYQAVFLDNGQVYFGKIIDIDSKFVVLNDVYYIQSGETKDNKLSMIKLGSEIHGPTDEMFISNTHVLFYENLGSGSKVLESIESMKK